MTLYIIRGTTVAALASPPAAVSEEELLVHSIEDLEASNLTKPQLWIRGEGIPNGSRI